MTIRYFLIEPNIYACSLYIYACAIEKLMTWFVPRHNIYSIWEKIQRIQMLLQLVIICVQFVICQLHKKEMARRTIQNILAVWLHSVKWLCLCVCDLCSCIDSTNTFRLLFRVFRSRGQKYINEHMKGHSEHQL